MGLEIWINFAKIFLLDFLFATTASTTLHGIGNVKVIAFQ